MKIRIFIFVLITAVFMSLSFAQEEAVIPENKPQTLDLLVSEALRNNLQVQAVYNEWQAAEYKVQVVKGLPDPRLSFSYFGENVETRVGPQESKFGASQKIPFPAKLIFKGKAQGRHAEMIKERYEAAKREVIKKVKFVYYDIFWVDRALGVTEEEKTILQNLERIAQRRYESNLTPQQDAIKAQVEISKLIDKLVMLKQSRKSLAAKMNSILNRPQSKELGRVEDAKLRGFDYELGELHTIANAFRQELLAANLDIERAQYEKSLAKLDYIPDLTLGFNYIRIGEGHTTMSNDGQDAWMGTVAINLPVWFDRLGAQLKEKQAALDARRKYSQDLENRVAYEVEDLYFKIIAYKDIVSLYRTALIPQTEQAFKAARIGYETGKVDFLNWLDSQRVLLKTRLAYYKAVVDYQKSIAYLERIVGKDL